MVMDNKDIDGSISFYTLSRGPSSYHRKQIKLYNHKHGHGSRGGNELSKLRGRFCFKCQTEHNNQLTIIYSHLVEDIR